VEGGAEQPALPATTDEVGDVQEWLRRDLSIADEANPPRLLDDEETSASIAWINYLDRSIEAVGYKLDTEINLHRLNGRTYDLCLRDEGGHHQRHQQEDMEQMSMTPWKKPSYVHDHSLADHLNWNR
jgi:hypothetical protein